MTGGQSSGNASVGPMAAFELPFFWQVPWMLTAAWWYECMQALWAVERHPGCAHGDHDQLAVPENFEIEGESGLFA